LAKAGSSMAARMAIIAMTTKSSIRVNPADERFHNLAPRLGFTLFDLIFI
jgi:hypothetical protein